MFNKYFKQQSLVPEGYKEVKIKDMKDGQVGYTVSWALCYDNDDMLWINGNYTIEARPMGTCHIKIERYGNYIKVDRNSFTDDYDKKLSQSNSWGTVPVILVM